MGGISQLIETIILAFPLLWASGVPVYSIIGVLYSIYHMAVLFYIPYGSSILYLGCATLPFSNQSISIICCATSIYSGAVLFLFYNGVLSRLIPLSNF